MSRRSRRRREPADAAREAEGGRGAREGGRGAREAGPGAAEAGPGARQAGRGAREAGAGARGAVGPARRAGASAGGSGVASPSGSGWGLGVQVAFLAAVFGVTVLVAELAGAANLGVALGIGQIAFAIAVVYLLVRR
jgi:hypothetical protein